MLETRILCFQRYNEITCHPANVAHETSVLALETLAFHEHLSVFMNSRNIRNFYSDQFFLKLKRKANINLYHLFKTYVCSRLIYDLSRKL